MKHVILTIAFVLVSLLPSRSVSADAPAKIIEVKKIWDKAPHNAFTDLVRFKGRWFCVFREGKAHASPGGALRVLASVDGAKWSSAALIRLAPKNFRALSPKVPPKGSYADLRDPRICITPVGRLMLNSAIACFKLGQVGSV